LTKQRDPRKKKLLSLTRDHRVFPLEGDKTFRKKWPRTKAIANRKVRRAEQLALQVAREKPEVADVAVHQARSRHKRKLTKHGVVSLAQHLEVQADKSLRWTAVTDATNKEVSAFKKRRLRGSKPSTSGPQNNELQRTRDGKLPPRR
jgi:hypothetical protein